MVQQMDDSAADLMEGILLALANGLGDIVLWGVNARCLRVLSMLSSGGLVSHVSALVDSRDAMHGRHLFGLQVVAPTNISGTRVGILVITSDQDKEHALEEYAKFDDRLPHVVLSGSAHYEFNDPAYQDIISSCSVKSKAGGYPHMQIHLYQCLQSIAMRGLQGDVAEFGVFQGGTTVFISKVLQHYGHTGRIYGFDTFSGFPDRKSVLDLYSDRRCEFPDYQSVERYCAPYNIELVSGDICETHRRLIDVPLVLSFFDTDNYSATRMALETCFDQTVAGGFLAFDHFYSPTWQQTTGERIAIRQVLQHKAVFNLHGTGIFMKL